jgi:SH3-like domain-containing protein
MLRVPQKQRKIINIFIVFLFLLQLIIANTGRCDFSIIQGEKAALHESPEQKSKILWEYGSGFPLEILKRKGDWCFVRDFEKDSGWIHKSRLQKGKHVIVKSNKNEEKTVNLRSSPNTDSPVTANAYYGVVFVLLDRKKSWIEVRHESGVTGWLKSEFVWGL